jgi:hypothetical protein
MHECLVGCMLLNMSNSWQRLTLARYRGFMNVILASDCLPFIQPMLSVSGSVRGPQCQSFGQVSRHVFSSFRVAIQMWWHIVLVRTSLVSVCSILLFWIVSRCVMKSIKCRVSQKIFSGAYRGRLNTKGNMRQKYGLQMHVARHWNQFIISPCTAVCRNSQ